MLLQGNVQLQMEALETILMLLPLLTLATLTVALRTRQILAPGFQWGREPMRGVNIGGWLVLEPWITPSLFEDKPEWVVDEWSYSVHMQTQNDSMGEIRQHWETWFQFTELEDIARVGLNTIRIPIGYWSLVPLQDNEPYMSGAYEYLKLAITWAQQVNLKVMLDLHGAPGSQNSFDNSGLRGIKEWFTNSSNAERTVEAIRVLTYEFSQPTYGSTVVAIQVLNEPFPWSDYELGLLRGFYQSAYYAVRSSSPIVVGIDSAFHGLDTWEYFMVEPDFHDVALDTHIYSMFNNYTLVLGYEENLQWYCDQASKLQKSNVHHWTIVGEFTRKQSMGSAQIAAHTDCARWLNGRGRGARWENDLPGVYPLPFPGDCSKKTGRDPSKWDEEYIQHLGRSFETQTYAYEQASGWIQWTWKTEESLDWSMQAGITYGWIPTPIWNKTHGGSSNSSPVRCALSAVLQLASFLLAIAFA